MTSQGLAEPLTLRQTNVSNPSVIHSRPSQQSIAASEDYYSLSGSAASDDTVQRVPPPLESTTTTAAAAQASNLALNRPETPPDRYRTPFQSNTHLPQHSHTNLVTAGAAQDAIGAEAGDEEVRKTPMHGEGKRRSSQSHTSDSDAGSAALAAGGAVTGVATALRVGGIRRKPVPSTVMESRTSAGSPASHEFIDPGLAQSSVMGEIEREEGGASPGVDDTPYIRFAIDQLTRDEEVKGSRVYPDGGPFDPESQVRTQPTQSTVRRVPQSSEEDEEGYGGVGAAAAAVAGAGALSALGYGVRNHDEQDEEQQRQRPTTRWPVPPPPPPPVDERAPIRPQVNIPRNDDQPNVFIPVSNESGYHQPLNFIPRILRPLWLILFILLLLALLALLLLCAIWSLTHRGIFRYGFFGDANYFIFQYLPILLGMLLFFWLIQIQVAVFRIAPFIAMSVDSSGRSREEGALLPLTPKTFLLPYTGHFRARQPIVGFFLVTAWLQIFTIPLLASAFNVRSLDQGAASTWRWIATAGAIWPAIGLYVVLLIAIVLLFFWILAQRRRITGTGVRWDPRSIADLIVLLERSNALSMTEDEELRLDAPMLGYWRTSRGGNEVFHSYGVPDRSARRYSLENGRIREKVMSPPEPKSRFSDFEDDREMGREQRHSRENMLPKHPKSADDEVRLQSGGSAVPWFLRTFAALLWIIIAVLLLAAFLVASYLPATKVSNGFAPMVPALVSMLGFSGTNFLYSFVPALVGMICFLGMLDIDYAYRRLQPYTTLLNEDGELAEKSLLLGYTADLPGLVTASAIFNGHWRVAIFSLSSVLAMGRPILGGAVFWAQFFVPTQNVRVWADMPGYYALTGFVAAYALAIILFIFPSRAMRHLNREMPRGNRARSFRDVLRLVRMSRMLDDVAFHTVTSKTDLVTRLLSATPAATSGTMTGRQPQDFSASRASLADSVRGFGRARQHANLDNGNGRVPRYALGQYWGRDGKEYIGIDRLRS